MIRNMGGTAMKRIRYLLAALAIGALALPGMALAGATYAVGVDGLSCPFCAYGIEKQLARIDGVESVSTDLEAGVVVVTMQGDAALAEADVVRAVDDAGFTLRSFAPVAE